MKKALFLLTFLLVPAAVRAADGFVQFFEDKDLKGRAVTIHSGTNIPDMKAAVSDDGKKDFNDKASSAKYQVPSGWQGVLYDKANFEKKIYVLVGTGEMKDLSNANGKCSSFRWESTGTPAAESSKAAPTTAPAKP